MSDLKMIEGLFVSVFTEHYDYERSDRSRAVGDSHYLNVLDPATGDVASIQVRDTNALEFLRGFYAFGDKITAEIEYGARPNNQRALVTKTFRRAQRPADIAGFPPGNVNGDGERVGSEV